MSSTVSVPRLPARFGRALTLAGALAGLAGCTLGGMPDPSIPALSATYRAQAAPAAPPVAADWPRLFGSAELGRLSEEALADNFDIAAAVARIDQAEAAAVVSAAPLYPQLQGTSNGQRSFSPGTAHAKHGPFATSASNLFSLGLNASYEVDFFGHNADAAEAGRLNATASVFDRDTVALATLASLANSYFTVLAQQDRLRVARENIRSADEVLAAIKARLSVGTATALDVAQQETVVANQRAAVPGLEQTLQQTRNAIAVLAGRTPESLHVAGGSLDRIRIPRVRPGLPSQLLLRRPDIAAAEASLAAQNASVREARAALFPSVTLTGSSGLESLTLVNLLRPEALAASFAAGLTQPIFNGHSLQGLSKEAQGRWRELLADYQKAVVQGLTDVENALVAVRESDAQVRLYSISVASARKAYEITQARLREGTIDVTTVLNTEQSLFQSQDNLIQAKLLRAQALVSLFQALGGGFALPPAPEVAPSAAAIGPGAHS